MKVRYSKPHTLT